MMQSGCVRRPTCAFRVRTSATAPPVGASEAVLSATILPFPKGHTCSPEAMSTMGDAFDRACTATRQHGNPGIVREIIATRIIELAKTGERDAKGRPDSFPPRVTSFQI